MVVRKKSSTTVIDSDNMLLSPELARVKGALINLPNEDIMTDETNADTTTSSVKKKVAPKKKTSSVKKKTPAKAATKKAIDPDQVKLADIAKSIKMEPSAARRVLRGAEVPRPDGQWAWKKGSPSHEKVVRVLKESQAS